MKITQIQVEPIPGFDVDDVSPSELNQFEDWLQHLGVTPETPRGLEQVIVNYKGLSMHYRTAEERHQWLVGFECARSFLNTDPR